VNAPGPLRLSFLPECYGAGLPLAYHRQVVGVVLREVTFGDFISKWTW
jgi:hypothetical protein